MSLSSQTDVHNGSYMYNDIPLRVSFHYNLFILLQSRSSTTIIVLTYLLSQPASRVETQCVPAATNR